MNALPFDGHDSLCVIDWQDQYNSVSDHTQKGVDFCEKFAHFIKERCAVENDYANRLRCAIDMLLSFMV